MAWKLSTCEIHPGAKSRFCARCKQPIVRAENTGWKDVQIKVHECDNQVLFTHVTCPPRCFIHRPTERELQEILETKFELITTILGRSHKVKK